MCETGQEKPMRSTYPIYNFTNILTPCYKLKLRLIFYDLRIAHKIQMKGIPKTNKKQKVASFTDKLNFLGGLIFWGTFLSFRYISNICIATPLFLWWLLYKFLLNTLSKHDILSLQLTKSQYWTYLCCI